MIIILLLVYSALIFTLGTLFAKRGEKGEDKRERKSEFNRELINFLNYDGSDQ